MTKLNIKDVDDRDYTIIVEKLSRFIKDDDNWIVTFDEGSIIRVSQSTYEAITALL